MTATVHANFQKLEGAIYPHLLLIGAVFCSAQAGVLGGVFEPRKQEAYVALARLLAGSPPHPGCFAWAAISELLPCIRRKLCLMSVCLTPPFFSGLLRNLLVSLKVQVVGSTANKL